MIQNNYSRPDLEYNETQFCLEIAEKFEIPPDKMYIYLKELLSSLKKTFKEDFLIGRIDYTRPMSKKYSSLIKYHSQCVIYNINCFWEIPRFRKCIIAALILIHFKLDKGIKTEEEFKRSPTNSAKDYKHYLYYRMKNKITK